MACAWVAGSLVIGAAVNGQSLWDGGSPFVSWLVQFLATLAIELPMILIAWRFRQGPGPFRPWLLSCFVGNLISHPTVVLLAEQLGLPGQTFGDVMNYVLLETVVIAIEAAVFRYRATKSWSEAALMSLVANAMTAVFGAYLMFFTPAAAG